MQLSSRRSYLKGKLEESGLPDNPIHLFKDWLNEIADSGYNDHNAMTLSTVDENQQPDARIVLLRDINEDDLIFFTSYLSPKGIQITANNEVFCSFYWNDFERSVRMKGSAFKLNINESQDYFQKRPRGSQIAAWIGEQSSVIESREELESLYEKAEKEFENKDIPKPASWGGYRIKICSFEFFQGREHRLNDRIKYELLKGKWMPKRLAP